MNLYMTELAVSDFATSLSWYRDVLGLSVEMIDEPNRFALLSGTNGRIAIKQGIAIPGGVIVHFQVDNLSRIVEQPSLRSLTPIDEIKTSEEGYRRAKYHDPDGCTIVIFQRDT